jgi:hypothetical protein
VILAEFIAAVDQRASTNSSVVIHRALLYSADILPRPPLHFQPGDAFHVVLGKATIVGRTLLVREGLV